MRAAWRQPLFLGMDFGTQSLKVSVMNELLQSVYATRVVYDEDLPSFQTTNGYYMDKNTGRVTAPSLMFACALDTALEQLKADEFPLDQIVAISGSGQQHGSVYWKTGAEKILSALDPRQKIQDQLNFSIPNGPIWMDSTTKHQCEGLEKAVGGAHELAAMSGSRAYERFTGPQIAKIALENEQEYKNTERISLISSYIPSLLLGRYASIDLADASGMNLLDIRTKQWIPKALDACAPNLSDKIGQPVASHRVLGTIDSYFHHRFGFSKSCEVVAWSGDNPNSIAGLGIEDPGDIGVSLGTSDTLFAITSSPTPGLTGHVFVNPTDPETYMAMLCYKNGSLARQSVCDSVANSNWDDFNQLLAQTTPGNESQLGFYIMQPEITPDIQQSGIWRFNSSEQPVGSFSKEVEVRAIIESQFLSMRLHAEKIGVTSPRRIIATGGGSSNSAMLQILADVFGVPVFVSNTTDSAATGAAYRALHGWKCERSGTFCRFNDIGGQIELKKCSEPRQEAHKTYSSLLSVVEKLLNRISSD